MMWNTAGVSGKNRCGSGVSSGAFFVMFHPLWIYPLRIYCTSREPRSRPMAENSFVCLDWEEMHIIQVREYLDLVKFSHTLFALPFALLGAVLAAHDRDGWHGRIQDWVGILLCMAAARTAAMAFNRLADRQFDALESAHGGAASSGGPARGACRGCLHGDQQSGVCGIHPALPAQSLAVVPLGAGPALAPELFLQQAFHEPGSFLAGPFAQPGAGGGLDRLAREPGMAAGRSWHGCAPVGCGLRHHLRLPGRGIRPDGRSCTAFPRLSACGEHYGSPVFAMRS